MVEPTEIKAPAPPPPPTQRRPRVREVSSRFMMTPSASHSSSSSTLSPLLNPKPRPNSVHGHRSYSDENKADPDRSPNHRKPNQPRAVAKLVFKENHRPDTPTVFTSSRSRSLNTTTNGNISAASKLLLSSGLSSDSASEQDSSNNQLVRSGSARDLQASMPEGETNLNNSRMTTPAIVVSSRYLAERRAPNSAADTPCSRSLDLPRSRSEGSSLFHSLKASDRERERNSNVNSVKVSGNGLPLPPPPPQARLTASSSSLDSLKKGKKVSGHQEDVHSLKLLYNRYLQWRYCNAKAEASSQSQRRETERALYSLGTKIAELYDLVTRKRIELCRLQRMRTLLQIFEVQMPYLDEWSTLEEDYAISLSEAIQALLNASIQLPIGGNVKADKMEVQEALNSAMKLMESIALHIRDFLSKAEQTEILISDLARMSGGERALIEECGVLLSVAYKSQVEECSLRSQLIQLHRGTFRILQADEHVPIAT